MSPANQGFTLIELVSIIILIGILSVTAVARFPSGFEQNAAEKEMILAIRYSQHMAMTRQYSGIANAWGIVIDPVTNRYSVGQRNQACTNNNYCNRRVLDQNIDITTNITGHSIWFNGLGQPFDDNNIPLTPGARLAIGPVGDCTALTISPETGFVQRGAGCP